MRRLQNSLHVVAVFLFGALSTPAVAAAAVADRLFVTSEDSGDVVAIDTQTEQVVARIPVGKRPRGVKVSHDGRWLFVALSGSPKAGPGVDQSTLPPADRSADGIGVIDLATNTLVRTLPSGRDPEAFDLSLDGKLLFVSNEETAELSVLDVRRGKLLRKIKVGKEPEGVTVRPDGKAVYVTCEQDNEVVIVSTSTFRVLARVDTGPRPRAVAFSGDGSLAFVTAELGAELTVIDARTSRAVGNVKITSASGKPLPPRPMGITLSVDGASAYVTNGRAGSVAVVDIAGRKVARMIEGVGTRPWGVATSADGKTLYTANGPSDDVSVIDLATGRVRRKIPVSGMPWGLAIQRGR
jgi:YVTN family beta-propeller protein